MRGRRTLAVATASSVFAVLDAAPALAQNAVGGVNPTVWRGIGALTASVAIVLLGVLLFGSSRSVETNLSQRLGSYSGTDVHRSILAQIPILRRFIAGAESVAERRGFLRQIEQALEQANLPLRPGEAIAAGVGSALLVGLFAGLFTENIIGGVAAFVVALLALAAIVQTVASRERKRFEDQLPGTLNLVATSLRAGYSLMQALEAVAQEAPDPTGREFGRGIAEVRLGRSPSDALKDIATRMESIDFDWVVLAVDIQREVGGNLGEVLHTSAETMQHRNRLRGDVKALTAEGRISAMVLGAMPILLFGFLFISNRKYLEPLLTTLPGLGAMAGAVVMLLIGMAWLKKIVTIEL
ncbi:MAG: type II secretion system protein F [Acidimicrobiia bacterium]|nr:type II secretion system F family protein [Acidimicrobiia bacterium]NNF63932.1 type II secretion system protein F [Acidimicrobiia bacterium]